MNPPEFNAQLANIASQIAVGKAVLFMGAGVSAAAGLPVWGELLSRCYDEARESSKANPEATARLHSVHKLITGSDPLLAAEMLQRTIKGIGKNELSKTIKSVIERALPEYPETHSLHGALAQIPWSLVITTNYDDLFERALPKHLMGKTRSLNWDEPAKILEAIQQDKFFVLKLHGDLLRPDSLILSRQDFSTITYKSEGLNDCLRSLLMLRTFVFVGHSLRDPDLLHAIELVRRNFKGVETGPHFAVIPQSDASEDYVTFLKEHYGIILLPIREGATSDTLWKVYEERLLNLIRDIDGRALVEREATKPEIPKPSSPFVRNEVCDLYLNYAITKTGSTRGDLCFVKDTVQMLERVTFSQKTPAPTGPVKPHQIMGTVFLNRRETDDHINIPDVHRLPKPTGLPSLIEFGYPKSHYAEEDATIRSELAVPIYSEGERVGVLNLESTAPDRYGEKHIAFAKDIATQLGHVYLEAKQRRSDTQRLANYFRKPKTFDDIMQKRLPVKWAQLAFIIYEIDYYSGKLIAHSTEGSRDSRFEPRFVDVGLATSVMRSRSPVLVKDAVNAGKVGDISEAGRAMFNITGPVKGYPLRVNGRTCSILLVWSKAQQEEARFVAAADRAYRIAQLLVENQRRAMKFLQSLDQAVAQFDEGALQTAKTLWGSGRYEEFVTRCLEVLKEVSLTRVRLWTIRTRGTEAFVSRNVFALQDALPPGKTEADYQGVETDNTCEFTTTTVSRAVSDPYCRRQHKSMFGNADKNWQALDKDPEGEWAVCPLVKRREMWGFLSVDNHTFNETKNAMVGSSLERFQLLATDVVAHIVSALPPPAP